MRPSMSAAVNREPTPASVSSSCTPSGVSSVTRSSNTTPMRLDAFIAARNDDWHELERLVTEAGRRPDRLPPARVLRLGALYRAAAADLARLRRRAPGSPETARLEALVGTARHLVYGSHTR